MTESNNITVIRCRAIIIHNDKLLVVRHSKAADYYALPGGHLDQGEDIRECIKREIIEELGIVPEIGRLLYINNLIKDGAQNIEFFFEIINSVDYLDIDKLGGTHKAELVEIIWLDKDSAKELKPNVVQVDLNNGTILSDKVKFI